MFLVAVAGPVDRAVAGGTALGFAVNDYEAPCPQSPLEECVASWSEPIAFGDEFFSFFATRAAEAWVAEPTLENRGVTAAAWTDPTRSRRFGNDTGSGRNARGADTANVALLCTHGAYDPDPEVVTSIFAMGGPVNAEFNECDITTRDYIRVGNASEQASSRLEVAIVATCSSAQWEIWTQSITRGHLDFDKGYGRIVEPRGVFNTWLGFHGVSVDDAATFPAFLEDSYDNGLGINWLTAMHHVTEGGTNYTQCPTAIIYCSDVDFADCDDQFWNGGLDDRQKVSAASKDRASYYYYAGCTPPDGGASLP